MTALSNSASQLARFGVDLASRAGLHRTYISIVERDVQSPTVDTLFRLCRALGIRPSEFLARFENLYRAKGRLPRGT